MRKRAMSIEEVKNRIAELVGTPVKISVNKGRKRIVKYEGCVESIYPSVFILRIVGNENTDKLSCSYSDVICGDIKLTQVE